VPTNECIPVENRLRQFALGLTLMVFVATAVELFLLDHDEEALQLLPFALCAIGFAAALAALVHPQRVVLIAMRAIMALIGAGGLLGVAIHLQRNFAFEQEIQPAATVGSLIVPTLKGAAPITAQR
jgi:hypothetical protein